MHLSYTILKQNCITGETILYNILKQRRTMGIYFGNHFGREPFQFDSVGNHWEQESVARPDGYPRYHYLQTESGCGIVSVKGEDILLEPGQGILLAPFVPHSYRAKQEGWITEFATFTGTMEPYLKSIIGSEDWLWISGEKGEEIEKVIAEAVRDFEENSANTRQHSLDCYHMLLLFMEGTPQKAKETQPVWEKYVQPVTARIETSYMEDLSAEKLAQSVYISPQYLSRLFVRYFNCSVYEYLTAYRINRAKELLILVGDDQTAYQMIDNYRRTNRYTALRVRLRKLCGVQ